jgi:hypothetical protein
MNELNAPARFELPKDTPFEHRLEAPREIRNSCGIPGAGPAFVASEFVLSTKTARFRYAPRWYRLCSR